MVWKLMEGVQLLLLISLVVRLFFLHKNDGRAGFRPRPEPPPPWAESGGDGTPPYRYNFHFLLCYRSWSL